MEKKGEHRKNAGVTGTPNRVTGTPHGVPGTPFGVLRFYSERERQRFWTKKQQHAAHCTY